MLMGKFRKEIVLTLSLLFVLCFPVAGLCTPEYAEQTSKSCGDCHVDPAGGGSLTKDGYAFKGQLRIKGLYKPLTNSQRIIRFIIGYVHLITAIMWFGTILYVHLILKPAYAAQGLPRSELLVGWSCIAIMALTGTLLSIARVSSWWMLFNTRFGVLLTIKIVLFLVMVFSAIFVTFVIGPKLRKKRSLAFDQQKQNFISDELSQFDGKEGRPAYLALKGNIYDVSSSKLWHGGVHMKRHSAGLDLSDALKAAPHGEDRVLKMRIVGKLLKSEQAKKPKLFYILAYTNLIIVFLIVFVICLWRWW